LYRFKFFKFVLWQYKKWWIILVEPDISNMVSRQSKASKTTYAIINMLYIVLNFSHQTHKEYFSRRSFNRYVYCSKVYIALGVQLCKWKCSIFYSVQFIRGEVLATNLNFLILISLPPDGVHSWYFKLILFDVAEFTVWCI